MKVLPNAEPEWQDFKEINKRARIISPIKLTSNMAVKRQPAGSGLTKVSWMSCNNRLFPVSVQHQKYVETYIIHDMSFGFIVHLDGISDTITILYSL